MIRTILLIITITFLGCKTQKTVTVDSVENNSNKATEQSQQTQSTANELSKAKITVTDLSEIVTEVSVIEYDSLNYRPVKETTIREIIKRNIGSVTEQKEESKHEKQNTSFKTEEITEQNTSTQKTELTSKNKSFYCKFISLLFVGILLADLFYNFSKRLAFIKRLLGIK